MKSKTTAKNLVRSMYLQAEDFKMNHAVKADYFINGFKVCMSEGLDQLEYWRTVVMVYPEIVGDLYNTLDNLDVDIKVKTFMKKMMLLK